MPRGGREFWQAWKASDVAWLRHWAKRGKTAREIGAKLGRSPKSVRCKATALRIALRPPGQPVVYGEKMVKEALRRILAGEKHRTIAADLGVSPSTISHWLNVRGAGYRVGDVIAG